MDGKNKINLQAEALERSLRTLIFNRSEPAWSVDRDYNFIIYNESCKEFYSGLNGIEIKVGISAVSTLPAESLDYWKMRYDEALSGEKLTFEFSTGTGDDLHGCLVAMEPLYIAEEAEGVSVVCTDITGRIRAEKQLIRLNRTIQVTSNCNKTIIEADNESGMLAEVCKIIIKDGGYHMAWIGIPEHDRHKTVRPVAQEGLEEGYFESTGLISWADVPRGRGPTGKAIRTGKPSIARNIPSEPDYQPWRREAMKRGYCSSIALPLKPDDEVAGVLNIYAAEPDAFDGEEIELLSKLADDLAFGLKVIRTREEMNLRGKLLKENEEKYRSLFNNANDSIFVVDPATRRILDANRNAIRRLGYSRKEILRMTVDSLYDPGFSEHVPKIFVELKKAGSLIFEAVHVRKDGTKMHVEISSRIIKYGGKKVIQSFVRDISERTQVEKALRESEEKFRNLTESTSSAIFIYQDNRFVYVNPMLKKLTGYTRNELLSMNFWDFTHPDDRELVKERGFARQKGKSVPDRYEFRIITRSGEVRWIDFTGRELRFEGKPAAIGTAFDITELKITEAALSRSEQLLNESQAISKAGGWQYEVPTGKIIWTDEVYRIHAVPDDFDPNDINRNISFYSESDQHVIEKAFNTAISKGEPYDLELRFTAADGIPKWVRTAGRPVLDGNRVVKVVGNIMDITGRKDMELALKENQDLLNITGRMAKVGGWEFDAETFEGTWTDEVARIHDLDPGDETNVETGIRFYKEQSRKKIEAAIQEALGHGIPYDLELEMITAKGDHKWIRTIGYPVQEGKKTVKIRGSFQDITGFKNIEAELLKHKDRLEELVKKRTLLLQKKTSALEHANSRLEEADRLKSIFLASMSHELRTPLNSIIGYTGIILMGMSGELTEEQTLQLSKVKKNARHLLSLINDILDISKIEADKIELEIERVNLADVIESVVSSLLPASREKNLELIYEGLPVIELETDSRRLTQVIMNLVSNAVKYTDRGTIEIAARLIRGNWIEIGITDTGIGITAAQMKKLFLPFQQIDASLTKDRGGTGLGLYLSKKLITLLGGSISVRSKYRKGSEFTVRIPCNLKKNEKDPDH